MATVERLGEAQKTLTPQGMSMQLKSLLML
jgi:hypothetical protein